MGWTIGGGWPSGAVAGSGEKELRFGGGLVFDDGVGNGIHGLESLFCRFRIGNFEAVRFVQGYDQLQGVHRIQADAAGSEERLGVADFFGTDLKHEVLDHQPPDVLFDLG